MLFGFVLYISILALGVTAGAIRFRHLTKSSKYMLGLLVCTLITELIAWMLAKIYHQNLLVYRAFLFIQYALIAFAYQIELKQFQRLIRVTIVSVLIAGGVDATINVDLIHKEYPTLLKTFSNILIILWSLLYLRTLLTVDATNSFVNYPLFWISIGWLLFLIVTLVNFSSFNYISQNGFDPFFFELRRVANLVLYSLFIVAFLTKQHSLRD